MKFPLVTLAEVATIQRDGVSPDAITDGTRYLGLEHIESGGRIIGGDPVEAGVLASTKFTFAPTDVLYGKLRPYLAKIALPDFSGVCSTDIVPIRPSARLDRRYLAYFLRQPALVELANGRATGANLPRLSPKELARFEIPLPPLQEQKRIAAVLDQADALRRLRARALERFSDLGQAIFHEMFGQYLDPTDGAHHTTIGSAISAGLIEDQQDGNHGERHPKVSDFADAPPDGVPFIMANCFNNGELDLTAAYKLDLSWRKKLRVGFSQPGDVLLTHKGTVGEVAVVRPEHGQVILSPQVTYYRLAKGLIPEYLAAYFRSARFQQILKKGAIQSTRAYIGLRGQKELPLFIPSLEAQEAFAKRVEAIHSAPASEQQASLRLLHALFISLQHRAFQGEL